MRISDWSSDVCSSDLKTRSSKIMIGTKSRIMSEPRAVSKRLLQRCKPPAKSLPDLYQSQLNVEPRNYSMASPSSESNEVFQIMTRSDEHTSELESLMRHSYAVFCLTKTKIIQLV